MSSTWPSDAAGEPAERGFDSGFDSGMPPWPDTSAGGPPTGHGALAAAPAAGSGPTAELEVWHETLYTYQRPVELAHHIAFLRPRDDGGQTLLGHTLEIDPPAPNLVHARDSFGNTRSLFSLTGSHQSLRVRATSTVRLSAEAAGTPPTAPAPAWEQCRARWRYVSGRPLDPAAGDVFASPLLPSHAALGDWARPSFPAGRPLDQAATELMHRLHDEFTYAPLSTHVGTPVLEAFEQRRGVCQDFAHVMIASLRALGLAARYVSGYLLTAPPPGQPKLQGADASHAWLAVALPQDDGSVRWLELDPTNDCLAGLAHVRLAVGRDYSDVTPLSGIIRGGGRHRLRVSVDTRRVA